MKILSLLFAVFFVCSGCLESSTTRSSSIQKGEKIEIQIAYAPPSPSKWHGIIASDSGMVVQKGEKETFLRLSKKQLDSIATLTERFYQILQEYRHDTVKRILPIPFQDQTSI